MATADDPIASLTVGQSDAPVRGGYAEDMSVVSLLNVLLRRRRLLIGTPIAVAVLAIVLGLVFRTYTAASTFAPQESSSSVSELMGLAAQFGVSLGQGQEGASPEFYAGLVKSRNLLGDLARTEFRFATKRHGADSLSGNFMDLYDITGRTAEERLLTAVRSLDKRVSAGSDPATATVAVRVTARWPELAERMNRRLLDLVSDFNLTARQSQAAAERKFLEGRSQEALTELRTAEQAMQDFLVRNRQYQNSPPLQFEANRLQRRIDLTQQVYTNLVQAYEQARIAEVRNTPVTTIIDKPEGSAQPSIRLRTIAILGFVVGLILACLLAFAADYARRAREENPTEYQEFASLGRAVLDELSPRRVVRRLRSGGRTAAD